jgi:hypothetical protein
VIVGYAVTAALVALALARVLLSLTDPANTSAPGYLPLAYAATAVLVAVFGVGVFVRRADVAFSRYLPWVVGLVSAAVSLFPWWAVWTQRADLGAIVYRGLRVPQGPFQFWDIVLPLKSIDCASFGFDVYAENNGCLQDPSIYGPGVLWLQYVPFDLFSERYATGIGVVMMLVSSLVLLWLARNTTGLGQAVLLVAAVGGPWLLLLERGNLDALLLWTAAATVILVRRWPSLWAWSLAAALIWLMGTWKYYPFAMGLMLVPALRLRRGWTVLVGYALATTAFMLVTWENFRFSQQSNSNMIDYGDFVVLGRVPVVARMLGTVVGAEGLQSGDLIFFALALAAVGWGAAVGWALRRRLVHPAMLGAAGSALFLASVVVAGFGYGYKATFLLLGVPLVAAVVRSRTSALVASSVVILALTGVTAVVVWNTVLATLAGVVVAGFVLGLSGVLLLRAIWPRQWTRRAAAPVSA